MIISIIKKSGQITFSYESEGISFVHNLQHPDAITPSDDSLFRIAILSRPANEAHYSIVGAVPMQASVEFFEKVYNCTITTPTRQTAVSEPSSLLADEIYLCFSGGFDSIAAKAILPDSTRLISNEFGGAFEREALFFKKYQTQILQWDLRRSKPEGVMKFNESIDWRFMLAPGLLFKKDNENIALATGTILEASPFWYSGDNKPEFKSYSNFGFGPGVAIINPVSCITEYATTLIASRVLTPENLKKSLDSLAPEKSVKRYRKEVLLALAEGSLVPEPVKEMPKHVFGRGFGDDVIALYLVWKLGAAWVQTNYCTNVPPHAEYLDMSFFEKIHTNNLNYFNQTDKQNILDKLTKFGFDLYDTHDYLNVKKSVDLRQAFISSPK
ncbi:hypothetical protein G7017_08620 [Pseudomonas fulva]|uniref:Uncharacterized protein n=1 Tax=Pseudomonas fulva TaxID=47880 RepID=A0A7S9LJP8_9PSED|nr:hypothetical protein [Pseudomonas fulva]MBA1220958.1 hypothetical protein [Pseudomonas fulva]MBN4166927.1 hypothetical protein [Pseudomonas fulva]QPH45278.1 hypothetical protein IYR97_06485 [Pseudomonas fulva]QPH50354.1 hypothetical protein IZU98_06460 [Pseudomonas fulva]